MQKHDRIKYLTMKNENETANSADLPPTAGHEQRAHPSHINYCGISSALQQLEHILRHHDGDRAI